MKVAKAWDSREGSTTVVLVTTENQLFVHGNLGWMGPVGHDGESALEAGQALAAGWGLQECDEARARGYVDDGEEYEDEQEEGHDDGPDPA